MALWHRLAAHYRNEPIVLGYDLLNEPIPHFQQLQQYNKDLEPVYRKIVAAVRQVDRNHVVILGGAQWDTNFKVFGQPSDLNVMYTFHKYLVGNRRQRYPGIHRLPRQVSRAHLAWRIRRKQGRMTAAFTKTLEAKSGRLVLLALQEDGRCHLHPS